MRKRIRAPFDTPAFSVSVWFRVVVVIIYIDIILYKSDMCKISIEGSAAANIYKTNAFYECT